MSPAIPLISDERVLEIEADRQSESDYSDMSSESLPSPYSESSYYQPFPYVESNQHVPWTGPEYANSRWFDGLRIRQLDANPVDNTRLQNQCVRNRGQSLKYRGAITFAQLRVVTEDELNCPWDLSHVRSPEEKEYQENLSRVVSRILTENSDAHMFPHPGENPLAYSLLPPLRHFYLLNRYDQFIRKDVGFECRMRERDGILLGYHNVEYHKVPRAWRSHYYLTAPTSYRLFDVTRAMQVPTPPSVSYLTFAIKRSSPDGRFRQALWSIVSAEFAELAFHRFLTCARYGTDGQGGLQDTRLSSPHLPENTPIGRLLPIPDDLASLWYRMGIQNLVRGTEFSEQEARSAIWRSISTDWQDSPGFWWYQMTGDRPVPMPVISGITTDGRSYDYPRSRRPDDDLVYDSQREIANLWRRDEPFSSVAYTEPRVSEPRRQPRAYQDDILGTENGFNPTPAFPAFDDGTSSPFNANVANMPDLPDVAADATLEADEERLHDELEAAEAAEAAIERPDSARPEVEEEPSPASNDGYTADAERGSDDTPERVVVEAPSPSVTVTPTTPTAVSTSQATPEEEIPAPPTPPTANVAPETPTPPTANVAPETPAEEDEITPNPSVTQKKKLPLEQALANLDRELSAEEAEEQADAPVVAGIGSTSRGRGLRARLGALKKRSIDAMRGKSPVRSSNTEGSAAAHSSGPGLQRSDSASSSAKLSGKLRSIFRRKDSPVAPLTHGFLSTPSKVVVPSPEVSEVVDLTTDKPVAPPKKATKVVSGHVPKTTMPKSKSFSLPGSQPSAVKASSPPTSILKSSVGPSTVIADEGVFTAEALFNQPRERDFVPILGSPLPVPFAPVPDSARQPFDDVNPLDRVAANHALAAVYGEYRAYSLSEMVRLLPGLCQKVVMQRRALEIRRETDIRALDAMEVMAGMARRDNALVRADVELGAALLPARVDRGMVGTADPAVLPVDRDITVLGRPVQSLDGASTGSSPVKEPALKKAKSLPKGVSFEE